MKTYLGKKKKRLRQSTWASDIWKSLCSLLTWRINNFSLSCGGRHIVTVLILLLSLILLIYDFAHPASRLFFPLFSTSGPQIYFPHLNTIIVFKNKTIRRTRSGPTKEWSDLFLSYFCFWLELCTLRHSQLCENSSYRFPKILEHFGNKTSGTIFSLSFKLQFSDKMVIFKLFLLLAFYHYPLVFAYGFW